jgi:hypothetical protein
MTTSRGSQEALLCGIKNINNIEENCTMTTLKKYLSETRAKQDLKYVIRDIDYMANRLNMTFQAAMHDEDFAKSVDGLRKKLEQFFEILDDIKKIMGRTR